MRRYVLLFICLATVATAHTGVKNQAVLARMDGMKNIADQVKVLAEMARGTRAFEPTEAASAKAALSAEAARISALFEAQETDPKSESLPAIWENWADYTAQADRLISAANALDTGSAASVGAGLNAIGETCRACHGKYRIEGN